jgi:hypothetical protein
MCWRLHHFERLKGIEKCGKTKSPFNLQLCEVFHSAFTLCGKVFNNNTNNNTLIIVCSSPKTRGVDGAQHSQSGALALCETLCRRAAALIVTTLSIPPITKAIKRNRRPCSE